MWAASGAGTLGFDFLAYHQAANRVLAGERLYDPTIQQTGGFGLFYYPPPFVLAILPLAPLDPTIATWTWVGLSLAAFLVGVAVMPVAPTVRWLTVLLAGLSWPFAYAFKLGQVGPLLFLLFAIGWRWLDRPAALGGSAAAGAIVKIQPGLVLVWALLTRRWRAVVVGAAVLLVAAVVATLITGGLSVWTDYLALLRNVSDPISTPHNFTPGAVAYQLGLPSGLAATIQLLSSIAAVGLARPRGRPRVERGLVPRRRHGQPAPVAGALGPLRDAPVAPRRLPAGAAPVVGRARAARDGGLPHRGHARARLPDRVLGDARRARRGRAARGSSRPPVQAPG